MRFREVSAVHIGDFKLSVRRGLEVFAICTTDES